MGDFRMAGLVCITAHIARGNGGAKAVQDDSRELKPVGGVWQPKPSDDGTEVLHAAAGAAGSTLGDPATEECKFCWHWALKPTEQETRERALQRLGSGSMDYHVAG